MRILWLAGVVGLSAIVYFSLLSACGFRRRDFARAGRTAQG